jgi:hypothetical protein
MGLIFSPWDCMLLYFIMNTKQRSLLSPELLIHLDIKKIYLVTDIFKKAFGTLTYGSIAKIFLGEIFRATYYVLGGYSNVNNQSLNLLTFKKHRNRFQGIDSACLNSLSGRYTGWRNRFPGIDSWAP